MRAADFSGWLSAMAGLSARQRQEALEALEAASGEGRDLATEGLALGSAKEHGNRRKDALGTASHERVEDQGCPHCAGREIVGWGRSHGLLRFRCKSCGRTFNALTKTPMAHLRKKERWLDHTRAMIESKSLAKTAQLCSAPPTAPVRWRHRSLRARANEAPNAERDRESGRDLRPRILQGPLVRPAAQGAQARQKSPESGPLSPATGKAPLSMPSCIRLTAPR
jgi:transposase-like protein